MSLDGKQDPIYFKSIRKAIIAFSTIFNNVYLLREDKNGNVVTKELIPLNYGPKQHWLSVLGNRQTMRSQEKEVEISTRLPQMSFAMGSPQYAANRQLNPLNRTIYFEEGKSGGKKQLQGTPYDIPVSLSIFTKNTEDGLIILEQILPHFNPALNVKIQEIEEMEIYSDLRISLDSISPDDNFKDQMDDNRLITWDLEFTIQTTIYPPMHDVGLIRKVVIDFKKFDWKAPYTWQRIESTANQFDPPDYDKENSTTTIREDFQADD